MPELCRIFIPVMRTCTNAEYAAIRKHTVWDLNQIIVRYKASNDGWSVMIDGDIITVEQFSDLRKVVDFVAERNGWFTDYKEAKNYIARQR